MAQADFVYSNTGWDAHLVRFMTTSLDSGAMFGLNDAKLWGGVSRTGVPGTPGGKLTTVEAAKLIDMLMGRQPPGSITVGGLRYMVISCSVGDTVAFKSGNLCLAAAASKQAVEVFAAGLAGGTPVQAMLAATRCRDYFKGMGY